MQSVVTHFLLFCIGLALAKSQRFGAPAVPHWPITGWQWGKPEMGLLFLMLQKPVSESGNEI